MIFDRDEPTLYNLVRNNKPNKIWIDAYNVQISRMLKIVSIKDLSIKQTSVLDRLLIGCINSHLNYILKKHC